LLATCNGQRRVNDAFLNSPVSAAAFYDASADHIFRSFKVFVSNSFFVYVSRMSAGPVDINTEVHPVFFVF